MDRGGRSARTQHWTTRNWKVIRSFWRFLPSSVLTLAIAFSQSAASQTSSPAGTEPGSEEPEAVLFEKLPLIEAAALHRQTLQQAPGTVSVITREDIHRFGYRTLAEALSSATGFWVSYDRVYHYVGIRGMSLPGDYNTRFLVMINGHYLTENIYGSNGFFGQDFGLDLDAVDRIEIIRGPSSVLYGSNGMFATINIVTTVPTAPGVRASVETGSFGERKALISAAGTIGSRVRAMVQASVFNNAGQDLFFPRFMNGGTREGFTSGTDAERGYHLFANVVNGEWSFSALSMSREKLVPTGWYRTVFGDRGNKVRDARGFVDATWTHDTSEDGSLRWRFYYDRYHYDGRYDFPSDDGRVTDNRDRSLGDWLGTQLSYRFTPWRIGALTIGGEARGDLRALQENFDVQPIARTVLRTSERHANVGTFAQQEWNITGRLQTNLGLRWDNSDVGKGFLSPRLALVFQKTPATTLKLLYGRAFRNPTPYERDYSDGVNNLSNPGLRPEDINTLEAGAEHKFSKYFTVSASAYASRLAHLITAVVFDDGVQQYQNVYSSRVRGTDIEIKGRLFAQAELSASASFQSVRGGLFPWPVNSPATIGKVRLFTPFAANRVGLSTGMSCLGARQLVTGEKLPSVCLLDLTVSSNRSIRRLDWAAGLRNLTDSQYDDPVGLEHGVGRLRQNGISFFLKITWMTEEGSRGSSERGAQKPAGGFVGKR